MGSVAAPGVVFRSVYHPQLRVGKRGISMRRIQSIGIFVATLAGIGPAEKGETPLAGDRAQNERSVSVENLGNPLAKRYPDGSTFHYARTISDLQAFDGKLYGSPQ